MVADWTLAIDASLLLLLAAASYGIMTVVYWSCSTTAKMKGFQSDWYASTSPYVMTNWTLNVSDMASASRAKTYR